jgi:YD repeat-containing protein
MVLALRTSDSCSTPSCTVTYDASGRSATITDNGVSWTFAYDADGKLISACKSTACTGSIDRVDYLYDGSGHRTQIKETTSAGAVTTTDLRYQGDTIVQETFLLGSSLSSPQLPRNSLSTLKTWESQALRH